MLPVFDGLRNITLASVAFRLILSTLCGGIVGMEREFKRRSAGFRTHILICLGAAMTTLTSEFWLVYMRYYLDAARLLPVWVLSARERSLSRVASASRD